MAVLTAGLAGIPGRAADAGDWFLTVVTAGPSGAREWQVSYETKGNNTGDHVAFGLVVAAGGSVDGEVITGFGSSLILGVNAGPARVEDEVVPVNADAYSRTLTASGAQLAPGEKAYVLSFASGTSARPDPLVARAQTGSVSASMTVGTGAKAVLQFEHSGGAAAEAAAVGAGVTTHEVNTQGMVGGLVDCIACMVSWTGPDGRTGDDSAAAFAAPPGTWTLEWTGVTTPGLGRPTLAGFAPIGPAWQFFVPTTGS